MPNKRTDLTPLSLRSNASFSSEESGNLVCPGIEEMGAFLLRPSSTNIGWIRSDLETVTSRTSSRIRGVTDRKSTRLNSSHDQISYAVSCLQKRRPRAPDADLPHRRGRRADLRTRGRPLRRRQGGRHPGAPLLARLLATDPGLAPLRDGALE